MVPSLVVETNIVTSMKMMHGLNLVQDIPWAEMNVSILYLKVRKINKDAKKV